MLPSSASHESGGGQLAENVLHFARVLRKAGLPIGTDRPLLALRALQVAGIGSRTDLHAILQASLIDRAEHRALFDQAFRVFWRDPDLLNEVMRLLLPSAGATRARPQAPATANRRLAAAMFEDTARARVRPEPAREWLVLDAHLSWSDRERLRKADFDSMTTAEWAAAQRMVEDLEPLFARITTRRDAPSAHGRRLDLRQLLRDSARHGGDITTLPRAMRRTRTEPLVVIVDISGSMSRYSRMFLHFVHALANGSQAAGLRVSAFVFGTRLTHVTRQLRSRDPDEAIARVVRQVDDWSGGTRIGLCLKEFNQRWARRVPLGKSTVLLVTDGLEHAQIEILSRETERLARSCRRLFWLNPLLRYDAFEPKARGIRALLPHVDRFLPVHNLESLEQLAHALSAACSPEVPAWK
jgi:uncharacterized protein with von Willebrand factor type A (vWA) domain